MGYGAVYDLINNSSEIESVTVVDSELAKAEKLSGEGVPRTTR